ncbi:Response regulator receiver domain-containing protein [Noviherbaspirillum humi]|uniref:Response regulator receiver domain-containing protein n=1 Tax=Noviherbaspirillum humi TaxID=1688639 RepID=A0A239FDN6_9BURK|nr:response regulator [Noviherbaspirillum humi]SNS54947.1 Response regulator receiver domain-containing protein [Noviherbaspirillum humi]
MIVAQIVNDYHLTVAQTRYQQLLGLAETNVGTGKALVVNDQPDVLEILKRTRDINVLFSDMVMPDINGVVLAQEACKLVPGIKVVLASVYPATELNEETPASAAFSSSARRIGWRRSCGSCGRWIELPLVSLTESGGRRYAAA